MNSRCSLIAVAAALTLANTASAHFVWVVVAADSSGQPAAQVYFSELAEPDSADLLDKIAATQVWSRAADGQRAELKVTKHVEGNGGWWTAPVAPETKALSAAIKYGVITRGDKTFFLNYAAKYLDSSVATSRTLARDEALTLDIVPHAGDKGYSLEVLFRGKPVAGSEVVILDPAANETEVKTDEAGRIELAAAKPGIYSIRAKWVVAESGKEGDKEYAQVNHYCTLALNVTMK